LDFSQRNAPYYVTYYSIELVFDKFLFSPGFHVFPFLKGQFDNSNFDERSQIEIGKITKSVLLPPAFFNVSFISTLNLRITYWENHLHDVCPK